MNPSVGAVEALREDVAFTERLIRSKTRWIYGAVVFTAVSLALASEAVGRADWLDVATRLMLVLVWLVMWLGYRRERDRLRVQNDQTRVLIVRLEAVEAAIIDHINSAGYQ